MHFTKMLSVCCAIVFGAFLTTDAQAQCLTAGFGQWPSSTYSPDCTGSDEIISTAAWTDEYSEVLVVSGEEYTFSSSVATHYITISADNGSSAVAFGTGSVTWNSTVTDTVRFYTHLSAACDGEQISHSRIVQCGEQDCPGLGNIGDSCDDGNPNTLFDEVGADCVCAGTPSDGSCLNIDDFASVDFSSVTPSELQTISTCSFETEYSTITNVPVGENIEFTSSSGGYITVRAGAFDGPVVVEGFSPVTVVASNGADLFPHWNTDDLCGTATACIVTTVQCTTCATECPDGNIGDACDDGDPNTVGDVIGEDCTCAGAPATGDCLNESSFGSADLSTGGSTLQTISTCSWETEYSTITGVPAGEDIEFTLDADGDGGYITVRSDSAAGPIVAQGNSPLTVVNASGADLFPHWNTDAACGTLSSCVVTTVQCTSCGTDCPDGNIGDPCDDGNPNSIGETIQEDCSCGGGIIPPANDSCTDVNSALQCGVTIDATTVGATGEDVDPSGCGFSYLGSPTLWYAFVANGSNNYTVTVDAGATSTSWDGVLYVYSGSCGSLVEVGCSDTTFTGGSEAVELLAPTAGIYYVLVHDYSGSDSFSITLDCESSCSNPFPPMDESSLATTVSGTGVLTQWDAIPGQIGCRVQLRLAGGAILGNQTVNGASVSSFNIPYGPLTANTDYEWRVRCGCQASPLVANAYSSWQPFTTPGGPGSAISSFPSPTEGQSNVTFTVGEEGYTTLEVFDMSGRLVDAIFTGVAQADNDYRFEFDGSSLPNGVYIYRLTTENEVVNEKFMIAK